MLHGPGFRRLAMIGYAGGSVGRAYGRYWPSVHVLGIEIDQQVTDAGRRVLGLGDNPNVRVATGDGRGCLPTPPVTWRRTTPGSTRSSSTPSASPTSPSP